VNGKTRASIELPPDATEADAVAAARALPALQHHLGTAVIRRVVYVSGRILNIVV
jgi:leucyl-tRNA synthetase